MYIIIIIIIIIKAMSKCTLQKSTHKIQRGLFRRLDDDVDCGSSVNLSLTVTDTANKQKTKTTKQANKTQETIKNKQKSTRKTNKQQQLKNI